MANTFYAAAVKSGTESWKAFFFGSLDPGSFITVDKPPASLWVMELSARVFGFSSLSMLLPEAVAGIATVLILYRLVRRWQGEVAAIMASLALALTPVATAMFRLNNPDAFLTFLLVAAAWAFWSALETARTSRLVLCAVLLGLAFLTKSLQAFVVLPAFGVAYLAFGRPRVGRRVVQLGWAALALLMSSGWWVAIVEIWPASSRPYIGGSSNNSELNLIFGYNGFGRLFGSTAGSAPGGGSFGGGSGLLRMFNTQVGGQIAWLIPLALVGLGAGLWAARGRGRADLGRAGYTFWGAWALGTIVLFSETRGIFHPYYTVALAPAIAALAGGGVTAMWRLGRRSRFWALLLLGSVLGSALWAAALLGRTPSYHPGLSTAIVIMGVASAAGLAMVLLRPSPALLRAVPAVVASGALLAGPAAYSLTTIRSAAAGLASAGPLPGGRLIGESALAGAGTGSLPRLQGGELPSIGTTSDRSPSGFKPNAGVGAVQDMSDRLVRYLTSHRGHAKYLLAVSGSDAAAGFILATGKPVIAMGGFLGTDPAPTLAEFKRLVAAGEVHYVLVSNGLATGTAPSISTSGHAPSGLATGAGQRSLIGYRGQRTGRPVAKVPTFASTTVDSIDRWVQLHGTKVPADAYGGSTGSVLYYVPSSAA
jgi:4-amino-4-deoxy-L-arabinose transferase-like glycosyltransferase